MLKLSLLAISLVFSSLAFGSFQFQTGSFEKSFTTQEVKLQGSTAQWISFQRVGGQSKNCHLYVKNVSIEYQDGVVESILSYGNVMPGFRYREFQLSEEPIQSIRITARTGCVKSGVQKKFQLGVKLFN